MHITVRRRQFGAGGDTGGYATGVGQSSKSHNRTDCWDRKDMVGGEWVCSSPFSPSDASLAAGGRMDAWVRTSPAKG